MEAEPELWGFSMGVAVWIAQESQEVPSRGQDRPTAVVALGGAAAGCTGALL